MRVRDGCLAGGGRWPSDASRSSPASERRLAVCMAGLALMSESRGAADRDVRDAVVVAARGRPRLPAAGGSRWRSLLPGAAAAAHSLIRVYTVGGERPVAGVGRPPRRRRDRARRRGRRASSGASRSPWSTRREARGDLALARCCAGWPQRPRSSSSRPRSLAAVVRCSSVETHRSQPMACVRASLQAGAARTRSDPSVLGRRQPLRLLARGLEHVHGDIRSPASERATTPSPTTCSASTEEAIENPHSTRTADAVRAGHRRRRAAWRLFLAGVGVGARRRSPPAHGSLDRAHRHGRRDRGASSSGSSTRSGDWMHLLPGVTAIALCAAAALVRASARQRDPIRPPRDRARARRLLLLGRRRSGAACWRSAERASCAPASRSTTSTAPAPPWRPTPPRPSPTASRCCSIDDANLDAYYVKAAGQARFDRAAAARSTLLQAAHEAPGAFITWTLLGDLETRAGDVTAARTYYRHALRLDPREPGLATLVADPNSGLATRR